MKPHHWPLVALGVSAVVAITTVIVVGSKSPAVNMPILLGVPLVATYLAHLVSKRAPNKVLFEFRADFKPSRYVDTIEVTDNGLEIIAGTPHKTPVLTYGFSDLLGIGTRQAVRGEAPWITLHDGRALPVPQGDVVVLRTTTGDQVLPVEDPRKFVSLVRSRVPSLADAPSVAVVTDNNRAEAGEAPRPVGASATSVEGPAVALTGPSLAVRWLVGGTLALTGTVVLPEVALIATSDIPRLMLAAPLVAGVLWVLNRNVPWLWSRLAFLSVPIVVFWLIGAKAYVWIPVLLVLCPTLGHLGARMFRLGANLGRNVQVRVPLRTGGSLYVEQHRLVHRLGASQNGKFLTQAMWLGDLTLVQPGTSPHPELWPLPGGGHKTLVGNGPTLRLVARPQQWLLPVTQAGELAEVIRSRQATPVQPTQMSMDEWRELRHWARRHSTGIAQTSLTTTAIGWRLFAASVTGTFAWMFLLVAGKGVNVWIGVAATVLLTAWLLADWWRVRGRMRLAEHHLLPPGSRDWGETRPDHAPIHGWQRWR
ncbi:hypothetical protein [Lentzea aerocolonigenes]|uniref:hypothetical protein n=1 Tax=Lentzea aerocolonigenes TaxID=68170 RepID=UPI0012E1ECD3|nr:hypothetical protein [Lentzea aerocolonigenes]